jgi:DNA transposition AAA+ family ATPase
MYQDILSAMGIVGNSQPKRKKQAFEAILSASADNPKPIILDEADLLGTRLLESVRDLCKMQKVPWVLIGEESLPQLMNRDRRVWSRRCATMEFQPMSVSDITVFCREAADLKIATDVAEAIQKKTGGDIRLVELIVSIAENVAQTNNTKEITATIAQAAVKKVIPEQK